MGLSENLHCPVQWKRYCDLFLECDTLNHFRLKANVQYGFVLERWTCIMSHHAVLSLVFVINCHVFSDMLNLVVVVTLAVKVLQLL